LKILASLPLVSLLLLAGCAGNSQPNADRIVGRLS
jgi:hypothetical protein